MALPLPPASNLQAILLVTTSRSLGPRLVFHYPPISPSAAALAATKELAWFGNETSTASVASDGSSSDWDSSTENEGGDDDYDVGSRTSGGRTSGRTITSHRDKEKLRPGAGGAWGRQESIDEEDVGADGGEGIKPNGSGKVMGGNGDWDTVLGFKVDALEKILCPSKAFNKRKFELGVESVVFVGAPMFVRDDGLWKKRKKRRKRSAEERVLDGDGLANLTLSDSDDDVDSQEESKARKTKEEEFVFPPGFEPGYGHGLMSGAASGAASEAGSDARSNSTTNDSPDMTMFNVVFVLNPPALEYQLRTKDMYDNVTKKYAKALKYEQARFQYVWKESKRIIDIKQRAKESGDSVTGTWRKIISISPLAKSLATLFDAISDDKIAHLHLDASFNTSFQIPQADSTPYLPNALEPQMPGLWLTTSNVVIDEDNDAPMTQHAALLLLEDPEVILKDIQGDKGNASALAFYIRNIIPTKSLLKISNKHNILAQDMELIAGHLVYWRRARLIAPLHPGDTYIVSPNANVSNIHVAMLAYAIRFPTLPSLPKMLSLLSGTPKPYRSFIPTAEHRDAYMDILAWLMRGGWVTQLRTFAWVRVSPEIKAQVAVDMEREALVKKAEEARRETWDNESLTESLLSDKRSSYLSIGSAARPGTPLRRTRRDRESEDDGNSIETNTVLSPRLAATGWRVSPARAASDAGSTSSARTTIAYPSQRPISPSQSHSRDVKPPHRPSPLHLKTTSPSRPHPPQPFSPTSSTHTPQRDHPPPSPEPPQTFTPSIVLSPLKASGLEARWLEEIGKTFEDAELRQHWPMLLKHLDGRHAIEDISPREGVKRKKVAGLFQGIKDGGWLVVVRHW
jgi:hypothetical protein